MMKETESMDRITRLPDPILHHILSFLSEEEVVATCVLSKSWRHVVSTRPNLVFHQSFFKGNKHTLISSLDRTLHQRWHNSGADQNHLSIQNFVLEIYSLDNDNDSESKSLLDKWIPIVLLNMGVKAFTLNFRDRPFDLTWPIFKAESLEKLVLNNCNLTQINQNIILSKQLQTLSLTQVHITDDAFQNIMSSCPLIEYLTIHDCDGLRSIKVNKTAYNLKHFDCRQYNELDNGDNNSIEIDVPTIETISIGDCPNWNHRRNYFPHLKSLDLFRVRLSKESLDSFSSNFPCLQVLALDYCYGFEEFRLSSRSVRRLILVGLADNRKSIKVSIHAPNILYFKFEGRIPQSISFKTNSSRWRSDIAVFPFVNSNGDASSWLHKLHEMLKALSHSEIFLLLREHNFTNQFTKDTYGELYEPVCVGILHLQLSGRFFPSTLTFVDNLFRICRPRNIHQFWYSYCNRKGKSDNTRLNDCLWRILVMERERRDYVWQQDLEEVSVEAFDDSGKKLNHVDVGTILIKCAALLPNKIDKLHFRLKWRKLS